MTADKLYGIVKVAVSIDGTLYQPGQVVTFTSGDKGRLDSLVRRGVVKPVEEEPKSVRTSRRRSTR